MLLKLVDGEQVIIRTRAHHRALLPAAINLLVTIALMSFLLGYISRGTQPEFIQHYSHLGSFLIWTGGLLTLAFGTVKPLIIWLNRFTFLTTERIVQKNLIGAAQAVVVPLGLTTQVELRQSQMQSVAGSGDIQVVHGAHGTFQRTTLREMPDAEQFNTIIGEQLAEYRRRQQARAYAAQQAYAARQAQMASHGDVHGASFGGRGGY